MGCQGSKDATGAQAPASPAKVAPSSGGAKGSWPVSNEKAPPTSAAREAFAATAAKQAGLQNLVSSKTSSTVDAIKSMPSQPQNPFIVELWRANSLDALEAIVAAPESIQRYFREFLKDEHPSINLDFMSEISKWRQMTGDDAKVAAESIYNRFCRKDKEKLQALGGAAPAGGSDDFNTDVPDEAADEAEQGEGGYHAKLLHLAEKETLLMMSLDAFPRFLRSKYCDQMMAELVSNPEISWPGASAAPATGSGVNGNGSGTLGPAGPSGPINSDDDAPINSTGAAEATGPGGMPALGSSTSLPPTNLIVSAVPSSMASPPAFAASGSALSPVPRMQLPGVANVSATPEGSGIMASGGTSARVVGGGGAGASPAAAGDGAHVKGVAPASVEVAPSTDPHASNANANANTSADQPAATATAASTHKPSPSALTQNSNGGTKGAQNLLSSLAETSNSTASAAALPRGAAGETGGAEDGTKKNSSSSSNNNSASAGSIVSAMRMATAAATITSSDVIPVFTVARGANNTTGNNATSGGGGGAGGGAAGAVGAAGMLHFTTASTQSLATISTSPSMRWSLGKGTSADLNKALKAARQQLLSGSGQWLEAFKAVAEYLPTCIVISDMSIEGVPICYANPTFYQTTGYSRKEVVGRNCRFLQCEETDPATIMKLREAIREGKRFEGEILNVKKDGTKFRNFLSLSPVWYAKSPNEGTVAKGEAPPLSGPNALPGGRVGVAMDPHNAQALKALDMLTGRGRVGTDGDAAADPHTSTAPAILPASASSAPAPGGRGEEALHSGVGPGGSTGIVVTSPSASSATSTTYHQSPTSAANDESNAGSVIIPGKPAGSSASAAGGRRIAFFLGLQFEVLNDDMIASRLLRHEAILRMLPTQVSI